MAVDIAPVVAEFGPGSCTCNGDMTGCCVCSVASILLAYGKSIPRLADGTPNMRALGASMGARHRAAASVQHGLSLQGRCTPPNNGTNWCAYCGLLELRARGLKASFITLSHSQIIAHLKAGHRILVPGLYSRVPIVREDSYSKTVPARGRSDSGFGGTHMVAAHGITFNANGTPHSVIIADPDFGSGSRPVVPPHSVWSWAVFTAFLDALGWSVTVILTAPTAAPAPTPTPTPTPKPATGVYKAVVHPVSRTFYRYLLDTNGNIKARSTEHTGGFSGHCSAPSTHRWPAQKRSVSLVQIQQKGSSYDKWWIPASFAQKIG